MEQKHQHNMEHSLRKEFDLANSVREEDTKSYGHAMRKRTNGSGAIREELRALDENSVWTVEVPPTVSYVLRKKGVFNAKIDADGGSNVTKRESWPGETRNFSGSITDLHLPLL